MARVAEPLIKEYLGEIEKKMKEKLGQLLISIIDCEMDFYKDQRNLIIKLRK